MQSTHHIEPDVRCWHLACRSSDLRRDRALHLRRLGQEYAVFRDAAGRPAVIDDRCVHFGASLGLGRVRDGSVECPFHGWRFGADGRCRSVPGEACVPDFARQRSYPAREWNGLVFFFNGSEPTFDLPTFDGIEDGELLPAKPIRFRYRCPWYMVAANGFDVAHMIQVHVRVPVEPARVHSPHPKARRIVHNYRVAGTSFGDRLLRRLGGGRGRLEFTSWLGQYILAVADFGSTRRNYMLFSLQPGTDDETITDLVTFTRVRRAGPVRRWLARPQLALRRSLTHRFFVDEIRSVGQVDYNPETLVAGDRVQADYLQWLESHAPHARGDLADERGPSPPQPGRTPTVRLGTDRSFPSAEELP